MVDLYSDENFPLPVVMVLRQMDVNVLTAFEAGQANLEIPDDEVLGFATSYRRAVITLNRRDFIRLHHKSTRHAGIVVCTYDSDSHGQAIRIAAALQQYQSLDSELIRVNRK